MQEAGEVLSNMNHPAGDCPLCLYPLVGDDKDGSGLPFMKLMSCYHCFHRSISFALTELYCSASNLFSLMLAYTLVLQSLHYEMVGMAPTW